MLRTTIICSMAAMAISCGDARQDATSNRSAVPDTAARGSGASPADDPDEGPTTSRGRAPLPDGPAAVTALVGATVFDGTGAEPLADAVVVLDRDRIQVIGPRSQVTVPGDALVIDVAGKWIVPGLIDAHVHFFQSAGLYTRPDIVDLSAVRSYQTEVQAIHDRLDDTLARYLVSGQTAVVDMGGSMWNFEVRDKANGSLLAPRVAVAGPLIATVARPQLDVGDPPIIRAETPERATELARAQIDNPTRRPPDLLKVWFIELPGLTRAETDGVLEAVAAEADAAGIRLAVHATEVASAKKAVRAGARILVHSIHDAPVDDELVTLMRERDVILIPTLVVMPGYARVLGDGPLALSDMDRKYGDPRAVATWQESGSVGATGHADRWRALMAKNVPITMANLMALHRAGVTIAAGTDAGNIGTLPGSSLHAELGLMVEAGMTPRDAIIAATRDAAKVFAAAPEIGTLEPGKLADLLVLDQDPLADIQNLTRMTHVVKGGVVLEPGQILAPNPAYAVEGQARAYQARDVEAFLAWYADDVEIVRFPGGELRASGKDAMRQIYTGLFANAPELKLHILSRVVQGNMVVDHELVTGIPNNPYVHAVAIYQVEDGVIERVWFLPQAE